jgi:hypothetical protein
MAAANRPNWTMSSNRPTPPGKAPTRPLDADSAYEVRLKLTPSTSGPKVAAAQYTSTRWAMERGLRTRQMPLRVRSIVSSSDSALATSTSKPSVPSRLALLANWVSAPSTGLAMPSGTRLCRKYFCRATWNCENMGKAVNTASITVSMGTMAISVVKVRLPAV